MAIPSCWNCGYELTGMKVEDRCPECGVDVWSRPPTDFEKEMRTAKNALIWGVVAIVTFFACLGPFAGFIAIVPLVMISSIRSRFGPKRDWPTEVSSALTAGKLAWITIALSVLGIAVYGAFFLSMIVLGGGGWPGGGP